MTTRTILGWAAAVAALVPLAFVPSFLSAYGLALMIGMAGSVALATAWALFSGPTRYASLATAAFFGIGAYVSAALHEVMAYPLVLVCATAVGLVVAAIVGLSTLRLAGVYFVIFSFGLAELVRQLVTWYEVNVTGTLGRYVFTSLEPRHIYWQLLAVAAGTLALSWWIGRSRLGLALKVIGDDEVVAAHAGIDITRVKLALFAVSSAIITLVGAIQAPRWIYIEPAIVFNPTVSFLTLIMALLGGANRLWGPALGAIPLFLLFEWLSVNFPNHYPILLGILFVVIVFALPNGVLDFADRMVARFRRDPDAAGSDSEGAR